MAKVTQIDVHVEVADEVEAAQVVQHAADRQYDGMTFHAAALEHDHPVAVPHFQLDEKGEPRRDAQGKPLLNVLRYHVDAQGQQVRDPKTGEPIASVNGTGPVVVATRQGAPAFPPPTPAKLRVRLNYR